MRVLRQALTGALAAFLMHAGASAQQDTLPVPDVPLSALPGPMPGEPVPTPARLEAYVRQADAGDRMAMLWLARAYAHGIGVAKDEVQARAWLRRFVATPDNRTPPDAALLRRQQAALPHIQQENERALQLKESNRSVEALAIFRRLQPEAVRELGWGLNTTVAVTQNLATTLQDEGQFGEALATYLLAHEQLTETLRQRGGPSLGNLAYVLAQATIHGNLATLHEQFGDYDAALAQWQASVALRREHLGDGALLAHSLLGQAIVLQILGRPDESLALKLQAREMLERRPRDLQSDTYARVLGSICYSLTQADRAVEGRPLCEDAVRREEARAGERSEALFGLLGDLADNRQANGDAEGELALRLRALGLAEAGGRPDSAWNANTALARMFERRGNVPAATLFAGRAVQLSQQMRGSFGTADRLADDFVASRADTYRLLARLLLAQGRTGDALDVLDMLRRSEADGFVERRGPSPTVPPGLPAQREAVDSFIAAARRLSTLELQAGRLREIARRSAADAPVHAELAAADRQIAALQATVLQQIERWRSAARAPNTAAAQRAPTVLPPGTMLLGYVIGDAGSYVYWSHGGPPQARALALTRAQLSGLLVKLYGQVDRRSGDPLPELRELHRALVEPIADQLTAPLIVLAAVDDVRFVPFAALHDGQDFLVRRFAFQSLTGSGSGQRKAPPARLTALGVSRASGGMEALPGVVAELCGIVRGPVRGLPDPAACKSWSGPAERVPAGEGFLDAEFTEVRLRGAAQAGGVVHLATHFTLGQIDSQSFLTLDGRRLGLDALRDVDFSRTALLTLSACDTARVRGGSQFQGLASFMLDRGAGRVIATQWRASDRSTPLLMHTFYDQLAQQPAQPAAQALRAAQLALLQDGLFAHPYYWAGFMLFEGSAGP